MNNRACIFVFLALLGLVIASPAAHAQEFVLQEDDRVFEFIHPFEDRIARTVAVQNGDTYQEYDFFVEIEGPGGFRKEGGELGIAPSPQPNSLHLDPGEEQFIHVIVEWGDLAEAWQGPDMPPGRHELLMEVTVVPRTNPEAAKSVTVRNVINSLRPEELEFNAVVSGTVTDRETGRPIPNAQVEVLGPQCLPCGPYEINPGGEFRITDLFSFRRAYSEEFAEYSLRVRAEGYETFNRAFRPAPSDSIRMGVSLKRFGGFADYRKVGEFEAPLFTPPLFAEDSHYLILYPFHNPVEFGREFIRDNAYLYYFDISSNEPLWQYRIYDETPAAYISPDGELVAIGVSADPVADIPIESGVHLLNNRGELLWVFSPEGQQASFSHIAVSDDKRYMAAGDFEGNLFYVDLETKEVLWQTFLGGQIRVIRFEEGGSKLVVSSGDGYLYSFDTGGNRLWRTYVTSWLLGFDISENYFLASPKAGIWLYLLDREGEVLWQYPVEARSDYVFIAPDESYMLYGTAISSLGTAFFTPEGELDFFLEPGGGARIIKNGELIFLARPDGTLSLVNRNGHELWSENIGAGAGGSAPFASEDATRLVVLRDNKLQFFEGAISAVASPRDDEEVVERKAGEQPQNYWLWLAGGLVILLVAAGWILYRKNIKDNKRR